MWREDEEDVFVVLNELEMYVVLDSEDDFWGDKKEEKVVCKW